MSIKSFVLLLPIVALWGFVPALTPTQKMFAVSLSMFFFIKAHALLIYRANSKIVAAGCGPSWLETTCWFVGWAGLDPIAFFDCAAAGQGSSKIEKRPFGPPMRSVFEAVFKISIGLVLIVIVAPKLIPVSQLLGGWVGMAGIVLLLHCGIIHLTAILWNMNERPVEPIMNSPLRATTVSEFWSKRWNLAFRDYAHSCIFSPLARKTNGPTAVVAGFLFSGIVHDLAISVPAGGGYGWPTLYFALQAMALLVERYLRKLGWSFSGHWKGNLWTAFWVIGPAVIVPLVEWLSIARGG